MAIILEKGQKINLKKESGETLSSFCVGVNWGALEVEKKKLFGTKKVKQEVDLDLSAVMVDAEGQPVDHIYSPLYNAQMLQKAGLPPGKLNSVDGSMLHSGDDLTGDMDGDDGLDNEIISVNTARIDPKIQSIYFFLNNVGPEDFSLIPFAKIRMYEGTPDRVNRVHAEFDVVSESAYRGKRAMIMGKLYRRNNEWKFGAIGDATDDPSFAHTLINIVQNYK